MRLPGKSAKGAQPLRTAVPAGRGRRALFKQPWINRGLTPHPYILDTPSILRGSKLIKQLGFSGRWPCARATRVLHGEPPRWLGALCDTARNLASENRCGHFFLVQQFRCILTALSKSAAMIEFDLDGNILNANENFCRALGYELTEIKGKHHRMFVDPAESASPDYVAFWADLKRGQFLQRQYRRIAKGGAPSGSKRPTTRSFRDNAP